ncbi:predicted protein [Arabidopsis lyrata subsp. lyrata]|uniref:Predicted protein n=1 Tax=Arabidopsis lyrata subsp. lyrata TaxID=81972 RepID=D7KJ57_ARALL|nr:predicted protein [Arabidopsis lyrata subsp. lyrata]
MTATFVEASSGRLLLLTHATLREETIPFSITITFSVSLGGSSVSSPSLPSVASMDASPEPFKPPTPYVGSVSRSASRANSVLSIVVSFGVSFSLSESSSMSAVPFRLSIFDAYVGGSIRSTSISAVPFGVSNSETFVGGSSPTVSSLRRLSVDSYTKPSPSLTRAITTGDMILKGLLSGDEHSVNFTPTAMNSTKQHSHGDELDEISLRFHEFEKIFVDFRFGKK